MLYFPYKSLCCSSPESYKQIPLNMSALQVWSWKIYSFLKCNVVEFFN